MPTGHPLGSPRPGSRTGDPPTQRRGPDASALRARAPRLPDIGVLTRRLVLGVGVLEVPNSRTLTTPTSRRTPIPQHRDSGLGFWGSPTSRSCHPRPAGSRSRAPQDRDPDPAPDPLRSSSAGTHCQGQRLSQCTQPSPAQSALPLGSQIRAFRWRL